MDTQTQYTSTAIAIGITSLLSIIFGFIPTRKAMVIWILFLVALLGSLIAMFVHLFRTPPPEGQETYYRASGIVIIGLAILMQLTPLVGYGLKNLDKILGT